MAEKRKTMSREEMTTALSTELQNTAEALPADLNVTRFANNAIALLKSLGYKIQKQVITYEEV